MSEPLHHLALADEWEAAVAAGGPYDRSTIGRSRADEGFIHLSFASQVQGTADRYYGEADEVVLLTIDPDRAGAEVRLDDIGGGVVFPHLYGPLPLEAVVEVRPLTRGADGRWQATAR